MSKTAGGFILIALLLPVTLGAQELPRWKQAEHWCINHSVPKRTVPCNETAHVLEQLVGSPLVAYVFRIEVNNARKVVLGLRVAKEMYDIQRWGLRGHEVDIAADLLSSLLGYWLVPKVWRKAFRNNKGG